MGAPLVDGFIEQDARGIISGRARAEAICMRSHRLIPERNRHDQDQRTLYAVVEQ